MRITLDIKDNKAAAFVNFIKSLDFVRINKQEEHAEPTKQEILESIKQGMKEVHLHTKGKIKLQSARDFINEL